MDYLLLISCFLWFGIGYVLGTKTDIKQEYENIRKSIKQSTVPSGVIQRPSVDKVLLWSKPELEKEEAAFKESFTKDIGDPTKKL